MFRTSEHLSYRPVPCSDDQWDRWVASHPDGHLLQTSRWGSLKQQFGWRQRRATVVDEDGAIRGGALILLRRAFGLTLAYVPKGPLTDWRDRGLTEAVLAAVRDEGRRGGAAVLKIEPDLPDTADHRALLAAYGFTPSRQSIQPSSTIVVDLTGDEDLVLQRMKSKWRYNVRLAERKGVTVRAMTRADLPILDELMSVTGQRDGFAVHEPAYYATAFDLLAPDHAVFLLAEFAGEPLASIVVAATGQTAWYLWGASSDRERNRMPNHALQWAAMRWARARGVTRYDFWGIPDPIGQVAAALRRGDGSGTPCDEIPLDIEQLPHAGLWGVYRFKQGFGGNVVRFVGPWDTALEPMGYLSYRIGITAQEGLKRLRKAESVELAPSPLSVWSPGRSVARSPQRRNPC